jgi:acyl carrier protein
MNGKNRNNLDNITARLANCFRSVFPALPEGAIPGANQANVAAWDSVATITLINVIDDEFHVLLDYERLAEFDSFAAIHAFLEESPAAS